MLLVRNMIIALLHVNHRLPAPVPDHLGSIRRYFQLSGHIVAF